MDGLRVGALLYDWQCRPSVRIKQSVNMVAWEESRMTRLHNEG